MKKSVINMERIWFQFSLDILQTQAGYDTTPQVSPKTAGTVSGGTGTLKYSCHLSAHVGHRRAMTSSHWNLIQATLFMNKIEEKIGIEHQGLQTKRQIVFFLQLPLINKRVKRCQG